jgi:trehalose 6-phosphate synthase/phosphatase
MEYFLRCVLRILGFEHRMGRLVAEDHVVKVGTFPMGIDFQEFHAAAGSPEVREEKQKLERAWGGCKLILSVDRQDYSKGILHRLEGFEMLLERNPDWRGKVTLFMIVVPSRIGIEDYERMRNQIEELVGRINGKFGSLLWVPIVYQYRGLPFPSLVAAYAVSDVALVTPLRDGMNLVAKEYIASKTDKTGVLILSEMAGAAKELREAIIINPNNREEVAGALKEALEMPCEEQVRRNEIMQKRLRRYDIARWAGDFLKELILMTPPRERLYATPFGPGVEKEICARYRESARGLFLLDYDGTLVALAQRPDLAKPTGKVFKVLDRLAADSRNEVVLISGRDRTTIETWLGALPIALVAEHGAWLRKRNEDWKLMKPLTAGWKTKLLPVLEMYADRLPGAFVEEKEFALAWHYRASDPEEGTVAARELTDDLLAFTSNIDIQVLHGSKVIEIRNAGIDKGLASQQWLAGNDFDFILAVGDDTMDEEMFAVLPVSAYSVRVGIARTRARFTMREQSEVLPMLERLAEGERV